MNDISTVPMYIPILISLAILMVPGVAIETYWWLQDRRRSQRGEAVWGVDERRARGPLSREEEERTAA